MHFTSCVVMASRHSYTTFLLSKTRAGSASRTARVVTAENNMAGHIWNEVNLG